MYLEFQQTQPKGKNHTSCIPLRKWEVQGADVFQVNNKNYLCIVDYHGKFLVVKKMDNLSAGSLISAFKL